VTKYAIEEEKNCIERVCKEGTKHHKGSYIGIEHTRWATCGGKTSPNSHPHFDENHTYYLVHNGTIVNYKELKETYIKDDTFTSETDTEVIVQLLAKFCDEGGLTLAEGLRKLQDYLIGQWGLVAISTKQPDEICVSTYGSPILVGFGSRDIYVTSQTIAFEKYTKEYMVTRNNEIFTLSLKIFNN
jgi:glucosamine--fructose-6-phosphate aminotransferase (isomerizing)